MHPFVHRIFLAMEGLLYVVKIIQFTPFSIKSYDCMYEWYVEQLEVPYYFVLHPNKKASDFFLPEKSKPDITDSYIKSIARICSVNGVSINNKYK